MGKADLHIHTTASDGKLESDEIVSLAGEKGLEIISITDHDTIAGFEKAKEAGIRTGVEVIPGVELTCRFKKRESHLLAYGFDTGSPPLNALLLKHRRARVKRMEWIVGQLGQKGLVIDADEVRAEAGAGNVGRPHIASVLVKKGYAGGAGEAFIRYLGDHVLGPIPNYYTDYEKAIKVFMEAGGVTILAHPGVLYSDKELKEWIEAGVDGFEAVHPSHDFKLLEKYRKLAEKHELLVTGGSDYHGRGGEHTGHFGVVTIDLAWVERLKRISENRKQVSV